MLIGVGSANPVKREATERAVAAVGGFDGFSSTTRGASGDAAGGDSTSGYPASETATVEAYPVPSGVPEQPRGTFETRVGAVNRAEAVLAIAGEDTDSADGGCDLGVGIEGGVTEYDGERDRSEPSGRMGRGAARAWGDDLFLVMWAAASDGDRVGVSAGPSLALPESIAVRVRNGEELGPVMDDVLGESDVAKKQGAAGALTAGAVDRTDALTTAVAGALGPFVTDLYE